MAPTKPSKNAPRPAAASSAGDTAAPLADYFFIAGIESSQVYEESDDVPPPAPVQDTIDEDRVLETHDESRPTTPDASGRRSRYSFEARKSIGSVINSQEPPTPGSNRSSTTIRAVQPARALGLEDDATFEEALKKFASERENFLEDIHISAGTVPTPTQRKPRPRTVRITQDESSPNGNASGLHRGVGSIRRRLSTMNSMRRQQSVSGRQSSVKTSKRLSGYNSVIPAPQPFHSSPDMHPLKRHYEPVLLDRYPTKTMVDESKRRNPFPDYVPMFAFPNDVNVVSSDERPRSSWHGFAMTAGDNSKLYGVCVTLWVPLNQAASENLEQQCEEWRKANMSDEERELASSLGERLSAERAKLSRLLAELPTMQSGSEDREKLEDEISTVEEKIGLMTDLLRPVRHGAASKIDGLTEGDTGFWIPRAYGILGRDETLMPFWKEWLKATITPMTNGAILRVPASSPKVGIWQPLERYVVNLCVEALSPITSVTQVEIGVRELRLYARKEAINEIPGSRNVDLYALFRCLTIPNIITLFEYALSESRIILLSSHTAMLHLACSALTNLLYPLKWAGVMIPVLPARLIQALEAPCPYIAGVERRYEKLELPDDDFCLVDLDEDIIEITGPPTTLPRPQRRKLQSLLQIAAPHHNRFGVPTGPPPYAIETFPCDAFSSENPQVFASNPTPSTLANYVSESSTTFGDATRQPNMSTIFNAFLQSRADYAKSSDRPSTSSTGTAHSQSSGQSPPSPVAPSPLSSNFPNTPVSRNDSGLSMQATLREKRSGHFADGLARRNSAVHSLFNARNPLQDKSNSQPNYVDRMSTVRRPSAPMIGHHPSGSTSTVNNGSTPSTYAPSVYAQSTLAASTIMPQMMVQPVRDNETTKWVEGHCLNRRSKDSKSICAICEERIEDESFKCNGCGISVHPRCLPSVTLVCPVAFRPDQVRAAFVRCFASLFYTYRRHLHPASGERRKAGLIYHFNMDQFLKSVPHGDSEYMNMLRQTQAFNEFIHERESTRAEDPSIKLFDEIILSKRNRGRTSLFSRSNTSFLSDTSDHLWRNASATQPNGRVPGDRVPVSGRTPASLDPTLMSEPRAIQGAPRLQQARTKRKPVASMLGLSSQSADQ
ncbi:DENN-domain-containing protein [Hortaea werneckii]|nr:DENN-domain-containing protein [Hortaea werneckii]KAI6872618.1 DENN-domain-containing protein [Hortaea werneckii]KAI7356856.1 DENN-domain-containing protein [Hortaea werneckii]